MNVYRVEDPHKWAASSFAVPATFCPPHVYCAFSVGKVKKKTKKKQLCRSYKIKSRSGVKTGAVMPRPVPPARLSKRPQRKVNPFALQSRQISKKNRRPPIKQKMKRNGGRKRRGDLHAVASLCARRYLYSLSNERGRCRCRRISAVRRGDAAFRRMREFPQKHQHSLTPKTMLTWI